MKKIISLIIIMLFAMNGHGVFSQDSENNVVTFALGSFDITILSEGAQTRKADNLIGLTPEISQKYAPEGTFETSINAFLVRTLDQNILVDAGTGSNLLDNLKIVGLTPEQINIVLITHMHGDHIGGLMNNGKIVFPNAEIYIPQPEHDYWMSDAAMNQIPENQRGGFIQARNVIKAYKNKLHLFAPVELGSTTNNLFPGFQGIAAYGHTPGHTGYMIESDNIQTFIWADLAHVMRIQMPHPEVAISFDSNPEQAVVIRKSILEYVTKNKIPVAGMHIVSPGIGDVSKSKIEKDGYAFEPYCFCASL